MIASIVGCVADVHSLCKTENSEMKTDFSGGWKGKLYKEDLNLDHKI